MILKFANKLLLKLLTLVFATMLLLFCLSILAMHLATVDIRERFIKEKLTKISEIFTESYKTAYNNTKNEKKSFEIAIKLVEGIEGVGFVAVSDEKNNPILVSSEMVYDKIAPIRNNGHPVSPGPKEGYFLTVRKSKQIYVGINRSFSILENHKRVLEIFIPVSDIDQITTTATTRTAIIVGLIAIIIFPLLYFFLLKLLRPITRISTEIKELESRPPASWRQLHKNTKDGFFDEITTAVNELIFRTQRSLVCQENVGRFLSHEIMTPLTHLTNQIEMEGDVFTNHGRNSAFCQEALADIARIRAIVNNVCDLAYADCDMRSTEVVDLAVLLQSTLDEFDRVYETTLLMNNTLGEEKAYVQINSDYFWILCSNILRNSLEHGNGDLIVPQTKLSKADDRYKVEFYDSGPGFPFSKKLLAQIQNEKNLDHLLKSHGAGLVLCLKLAEIMNLDITFENLRPRGAKVTILFVPATNYLKTSVGIKG